MSRRRSLEEETRQTYRAWIKWAPMLGVLFAVLFADAWLSIETRNNDYELNDLSQQQRELRGELETLRLKHAELASLDVLAIRAPGLGLSVPEPNQVLAVNSSGYQNDLTAPSLITAKVEWETMAADVSVLLRSEVPEVIEKNADLPQKSGENYLEESMEHLLKSL